MVVTAMHKRAPFTLNNLKLDNVTQTKSNVHLSYNVNNYQNLLTHIQESEDARWILFIAPPGKPNLSFFQQSGISKSRIITLTQQQIGDTQSLLHTVLANNNYAAVVTWLNHCDKSTQDALNQLTRQSNTQCFVYCAQ
ncbi:hypothetical protein PCNPT3_05660 [Psychromonas sp. CNPT3]|uniref:SulA-like leucine-rich domain-containing protein n=1 Tax=Psychromonas sp. CNPT3 TaxID=314282 RepID=UPI00006E424C|nr:SulA-like leucine-rich domain-containing protein [Psychromonas sp. CNPT3]AGH81074.1 hypothetical protein PCNPT3_05660 [Psychromonas sp. CNPT3]